MSIRRTHGYISIGIVITLLFISSVWYASSPVIYKTEALPNAPSSFLQQESIAEEPLYVGDHVVVSLGNMEVYLKNGTTTLETFPIISKGKPDSYYETIGGSYENDYKIRNHFSSIGHVYMPWSVHVYGNFFIHGIPYYEDGTEVSSTYSGGCIRLSNDHAERVYEFVKRGTPVIVAEHDEKEFAPTTKAEPSMESIDLTRFMVATVSLEVLAQDSEILDLNRENTTTRRKLLPRLITEGDDRVSIRLADAVGEEAFIEYMNKKAASIGMTSTVFTSLVEPTATTPADMERFSHYLVEYKTYLIALTSAQKASQ